MSRLESRLRDREYLLERFSLADIAFAPRIVMLGELGIAVPEHYESLKGWISRLSQKESVQRLER